MSVAKFVAANGREAMRKVREAMGPDAVVLSNRTIDGGVEIVAMRDTDLSAASSSAQVYVAPEPVVAAAEPAAIGDLRGELQSMRAMLERQLAGLAPALSMALWPAETRCVNRCSLGWSGPASRRSSRARCWQGCRSATTVPPP